MMMELNLETIETLINLATEKQLSELTVEQEDQKITIKTAAVTSVAVTPSVKAEPATTDVQPLTPPSQVKLSEEPPAQFYKVTSPMVGTFYRSPSPTSPPFVEEGSMVAKGQTLCIIEAMKLMNEMESEVSGVVRKILVENGTAIEFGQLIMEIEVNSN